jgi:hypothetical protein
MSERQATTTSKWRRTPTPGRRRAGRRHIDDDGRACLCSWQSSIWQAAAGLAFLSDEGGGSTTPHIRCHGCPPRRVGTRAGWWWFPATMAGLTRPCLSKEIPWLVLLGELDGMEATDCLDRTWFSRRFIERIGRGVEKTTCWEGR